MERSLLMLGGGIGLLIWLCGQLFVRGNAKEVIHEEVGISRFFWILALAIPFLGFLVTLPSNPPLFTAGHGLGTGFLIGGFACALAFWFVIKSILTISEASPPSVLKLLTAPIGIALATAILPSLFLRSVLEDALAGIAIGWLTSATILFVESLSLKNEFQRNLFHNCLSLVTGVSALLCCMILLGEMKGGINLPGKLASTLIHWSVPGAVFAALSLLGLYFFSLPREVSSKIPFLPQIEVFLQQKAGSEAGGNLWLERIQIGGLALFILIAGKITAGRFPESGEKLFPFRNGTFKLLSSFVGGSSLFQVILIGVVAGLLVRWILSETRVEENRSQHAATRSVGVACLVVLAGTILAMQRMGGFGVGIMLFSLLPLQVIGFYRAEGASLSDFLPIRATLFPKVLFFGLLVLVYRLIAVRFASVLHGVSLTDNYALLSLLIGAVVPMSLGGWFGSMRTESGNKTRLWRITLSGIALLAIPTILISIWGVKATLPLTAGLALGACLIETGGMGLLFGLAMALALMQWTGHASVLTEMSRDAKILFLIRFGFSIVIPWLLIESVLRYSNRSKTERGSVTGGRL